MAHPLKIARFVTLGLASCSSPPDPINEYLHAIDFSGAVLVVAGDETVLRAGYGFAERELQVANSPAGVFRIGSLTKPLTSTAVLHAADRGVLGLDDSVCNYLRVCPHDWQPVRIHQLLSHTSAIPDLFGALPSAPVLETAAEIDKLLLARGAVPLESDPGVAFSYSNFNYMLLGYVLEVASSVDWESYLRDSILSPVGAADSRYNDAWALIERRVRGYRERDDRVEPIEYKDHSAYAAGGLLSTVDDLRRWHGELVAGRVVSDSLFARAVTPGLGDYGFGWQVIEALGRTMHNHSGGISGFASHLAWYPAEELLIVLLSNIEDENVKAIGCDVARLVFADQDPPASTVAYLNRSSAERCAQRSLP